MSKITVCYKLSLYVDQSLLKLRVYVFMGGTDWNVLDEVLFFSMLVLETVGIHEISELDATGILKQDMFTVSFFS